MNHFFYLLKSDNSKCPHVKEGVSVFIFYHPLPAGDEAFHRHFYLGGHLNASGYRLTALMMESYIDYIIRHNPDDFKQIGFVGTPYHNEQEPW